MVVVTCRFLKDTWEVQSHVSDGWKSRKCTLSELLVTRLTGIVVSSYGKESMMFGLNFEVVLFTRI